MDSFSYLSPLLKIAQDGDLFYVTLTSLSSATPPLVLWLLPLSFALLIGNCLGTTRPSTTPDSQSKTASALKAEQEAEPRQNWLNTAIAQMVQSGKGKVHQSNLNEFVRILPSSNIYSPQGVGGGIFFPRLFQNKNVFNSICSNMLFAMSIYVCWCTNHNARRYIILFLRRQALMQIGGPSTQALSFNVLVFFSSACGYIIFSCIM